MFRNYGDLAISVYVTGESGPLTNHATGLHTTYISKGNVAGEAVLNDATTTVRTISSPPLT
jgi:hypothetical protein